MKNKKLVYILLPVAILIWGGIIFKIISYYFDKNTPDIVMTDNTMMNFPKNAIDTFSLLLNYPDPFLKSMAVFSNPGNVSYQRNNSKSTVGLNNRNTKEIVKVNWPAIVYGGIIKNKESKKTCSIVKINGVEHIMSVGDVYNDVHLLKLYKDSVVVSFKNNKKTFVK